MRLLFLPSKGEKIDVYLWSIGFFDTWFEVYIFYRGSQLCLTERETAFLREKPHDRFFFPLENKRSPLCKWYVIFQFPKIVQEMSIAIREIETTFGHVTLFD